MKLKNLKGILSAVLGAVLLFSLTACGSESEGTREFGKDTVSGLKQDAVSQQTVPVAPAAATIEETVMWDNDDIKITALSLTSDQYYHILNLLIENKTGVDLFVMASRTAVNSFVVEPSMGVNVPAGSAVEGTFRVWLDDVEADVIADIETRFSYSSDDHSVSSKTKRVKLETSAAASFDYSYDESGTVLHDADGIKIIFQGFNDEGNPMIYLSSTGELSEGCCVDSHKVYINGKETYSDYYGWVFTNTRNYAEMELEDEDLDGNPLGEVESLQVSFRIYKENMADPGAVETELVEIPVN